MDRVEAASVVNLLNVPPGNEGPYGKDFAAKCFFHWTDQCDEVFGKRGE